MMFAKLRTRSFASIRFGFCWFFRLLHLKLQERLEREFDMDLITTAPTVVYQVLDKTGEVFTVENPAEIT